jgi:hypothetical protein
MYFASKQAKEEFCAKQPPGAYRTIKDFFCDNDGILYMRRSNGKHQMVVPAALVQEVIRENYDPKYVAHPGAKRPTI